MDQTKQREKTNQILETSLEKTVERFKIFGRKKEVFVTEVDLSNISDSINYRSEILLYGIDLTLRFQAFYSDIKFQSEVAELFDKIDQSKVRDFFNEIANLSCGKMKEVFGNQGIVVAMSLPVYTDTDKSRVILAEEVLTNLKLWHFVMPSSESFYIKISLQIHKFEAVQSFQKVFESQESDSGDVDFF